MKWTEPEVKILKSYYRKRGIDWCAARLPNRTRIAVVKKAMDMGLKLEKYWTEREENILISLIDKKSICEIAERLGRTRASVKRKIDKMGIGSLKQNTDMMTLTQVSELVGLDKSTISKFWIDRGMEADRGKAYTLIAESDLIEFMQEYPEKWHATKCDYYFFSKYDWFLEKLKQDKLTTRPNYKVTDFEISRARMLRKRGMSYREIGLEMNKTHGAVWHILNKYGT